MSNHNSNGSHQYHSGSDKESHGRYSDKDTGDGTRNGYHEHSQMTKWDGVESFNSKRIYHDDNSNGHIRYTSTGSRNSSGHNISHLHHAREKYYDPGDDSKIKSHPFSSAGRRNSHIDSDDEFQAEQTHGINKKFHASDKIISSGGGKQQLLQGAHRDDLEKHQGPHHQHQQQAHGQAHHHSGHAHEILMMLIDGVGLAMVAGATLLEGVVLWKAFFHEYWHTHTMAIAFWFLGRFCQVFGLMLLVAFAASFDTLTAVEYAGMTLITIGPIFNTIGSVLFDAKNDPLFLFNKAWRSNELIEFTGMCILDLSYLEMSDIMVLLTEWTGFIALIAAATVEFEYYPNTPIPHYEVRYDLVHSGEAVGLMLLMIVAFVQYRERLAEKAEASLAARQQQLQQHHNTGNHQQHPPHLHSHHPQAGRGNGVSQQQLSSLQLHHRRTVSPAVSTGDVVVV